MRMLLLMIMWAFCPALWAQKGDFLAQQLDYSEVQVAQKSVDQRLRGDFLALGMSFPARQVFLRIFKAEKELELWVRQHPADSFRLFRTYPICSMSGGEGPKRKLGDLQVPEGFYHIDQYKPWYFNLGMRINYPNESDRILKTASHAGGNICIHGSCVSTGCIAFNLEIEEIFWLCAQSQNLGNRIEVHIFPARMNSQTMQELRSKEENRGFLAFWDGLRPGF